MHSSISSGNRSMLIYLMPKPKIKEQWAAILWENSKTKNSEKSNKSGALFDIIDLTCVPKKYRTEGCVASLKWVDTSTGKTSYHKAKVLKISSDKEALELLCINSNTGKIADISEKIFSSDVLEKKKEQQQEKKIKKTAQNKVNAEVAKEIAKSTSIFDHDFGYKLASTLISTQLPSTDSNYRAPLNSTYSQPMTASPVMTENLQCYPTMSTSSLSSSTQQYLDKSTAQELQPMYGPALQDSQPSEPLQSHIQISSDKEALELLCINSNTGKIAEISEKIFSSEVLEKKKEQQEKKIKKTAYNKVNAEVATEVARNTSIYDDNFGYKLATLISTQLPSTNSNYRSTLNSTHSQPMTASPVMTENSQCYPTMSTSLSSSTQQYFDKSMAQELQPMYGPALQDSQSMTESNIKFLEAVVTAMKSVYISENNEASKESSFKKFSFKESFFKISDFYRTPGKGKVEMYPGTNFYFYEGIKDNIMDKSKILNLNTSARINHWPLLVRHALIEVYGKDLASFSAKGSKKDGRPGIDAQFYKALYYWACEWNGRKIDEEKFIDTINKAAYNKRKAYNQVKSNKKTVTPS